MTTRTVRCECGTRWRFHNVENQNRLIAKCGDCGKTISRLVTKEFGRIHIKKEK